MENVPVQKIDIEHICREYGTQLLRMATLYLRDPHLAEDAVQETLIKVYRSRDRFDPRCSEKAWVMQIAVNTCKDMLRSTWLRRIRPAELVGEVPDPRGDVEASADHTVVEQVQNMPGKYRDVIVLFYYQELSVREISAALGISENAVRVRLNRGRNLLKDKLKGWWEFNEA